MNRDYFTKPLQHSRSAHDYGNSGPIEPMRRGSVWLMDYALTAAINISRYDRACRLLAVVIQPINNRAAPATNESSPDTAMEVAMPDDSNNPNTSVGAMAPDASTSPVEHTPGPWGWFGNAKTREVYLATKHSGRRYVMGFRRWGMKGAQPSFQPGDRGLVPAEELLKFEVGNRAVLGVKQAQEDETVYRLDIRGIDCADARLIAAAPDFAEAAPDATDVLGHYAAYIRKLPSAELECHPYLPMIEQVAADLRAAIAKSRGEQA